MFAAQGLQLLLPIIALYHVAGCFDQINPLARRTALAVRRLSHAMLASMLGIPFMVGSSMAIASVIAKRQGMVLELARPYLDSLPVVIGTLAAEILVPVVTCTCLYSLAWLIQAGADAADDAQGIV